MHRLLSKLFVLVLVSALTRVSAAEDKPNIIYLMLDEWGYFESGHMGSKDLVTPNIDTFAALRYNLQHARHFRR